MSKFEKLWSMSFAQRNVTHHLWSQRLLLILLLYLHQVSHPSISHLHLNRSPTHQISRLHLNSFQKAVIYPHTWQTQAFETSAPTAEVNTPAQLFPSPLKGLENPFLKPLKQKHPKELMSSNTTSMMLRNKTLSIKKKKNLIPKSNSRNP